MHTTRLKEAIVSSFAIPDSQAVSHLEGFSNDNWRSVMRWLDISGMAIYFLDRIQQLSSNVVPVSIQRSLEQRLRANSVRVRALQQEAFTLAASFDSEQISYALLKGTTLAPDSVRESALRTQTDLDFLVAQANADLAAELISRLGYKLYATSENTLEFRAGEACLPDIANIYSVQTQRALELHFALEGTVLAQILTRRVVRNFDSAQIASLAPHDIFVQQALHLLKHLCGEHTRLSWVLEFWRHANIKSSDDLFWHEAESAAAGEPHGDIAMAIAFWVTESMFGPVSRPLPLRWAPHHLPLRIRLWLERYVRKLLLTDAAGSKLYALLRREIYGDADMVGCKRKVLFPVYLPKRITEPRPNEGLGGRLHRCVIEADFFLRRLSFHVLEGIRFSIEASRWRKALARCGQ